MLKRFVNHLKTNIARKAFNGVSLPYESCNEETKKTLLRKLSEHALDLYTQKSDINNFTKLALSNPEDKSHEKLVERLLETGEISDPFNDLQIKNLTCNEKFLKDLGF